MTDFMTKMHHIWFPLTGGAYSTPSDPLTVFKGPNNYMGRERRHGKGQGAKGKNGKGSWVSHLLWPLSLLVYPFAVFSHDFMVATKLENPGTFRAFSVHGKHCESVQNLKKNCINKCHQMWFLGCKMLGNTPNLIWGSSQRLPILLLLFVVITYGKVGLWIWKSPVTLGIFSDNFWPASTWDIWLFDFVMLQWIFTEKLITIVENYLHLIGYRVGYLAVEILAFLELCCILDAS